MITRPLLRGVAVGMLAKGSAVLVGVIVAVGVNGVGVGVGSSSRNGRITGGLVRMVRMNKGMRRSMKDFGCNALPPTILISILGHLFFRVNEKVFKFRRKCYGDVKMC